MPARLRLMGQDMEWRTCVRYLGVSNVSKARDHFSSFKNSVFSGLSSDIQNDLIKSIAQVIRDEIKSEINFAKFVSVIADETPDISHREQMSVIFRYLTKTGIEERFVAQNPFGGADECREMPRYTGHTSYTYMSHVYYPYQ
ncbi:hypothetical protein EVAR_33489_1 [Eumeta japonica]|uniref:Uncharacterized protein n=1 Tax=Eumeta variegata TaxID=151549 RepID=A0A4C1WHZ7_EUMVA|nr:hypothetical protein EVAR_33489_1 [Eumeta japonica]